MVTYETEKQDDETVAFKFYGTQKEIEEMKPQIMAILNNMQKTIP